MSDADTANPPTTETRSFQADVSRLLELMVHSVYSERDIFIRELISNAADACEKLRYEAIAQPELTADGEAFLITVSLDKDAKTMTVGDNGVGMSRSDLDAALGTIASSGTKAFLDKLGSADAATESANLIGQFGIGFYSAFMVADTVVVETRRAGSDDAFRWVSNGKGSYEVSPLPLAEAPRRGTRVVLHLNEASTEFLEPYKIERIIKEHSGAVAVPIAFVEKPGDETAAPHRRRGALGQAQERRHAGRLYGVLPQSRFPVRRAGADSALARRGPPRIYGAGLRAGVETLRSVRPAAQRPGQALRAPCPDLG